MYMNYEVLFTFPVSCFLLHLSGSRLFSFLAFRCVVSHIVSLFLTFLPFASFCPGTVSFVYLPFVPFAKTLDCTQCMFVVLPSSCLPFFLCVFVSTFFVLFVVYMYAACVLLLLGWPSSHFRLSLLSKLVSAVSFVVRVASFCVRPLSLVCSLLSFRAL